MPLERRRPGPPTGLPNASLAAATTAKATLATWSALLHKVDADRSGRVIAVASAWPRRVIWSPVLTAERSLSRVLVTFAFGASFRTREAVE